MPTKKLDLVGMAEIAQMLGWPRSTLRVYRTRGLLPPAYAELACGPIYLRDDIAEWAATQTRAVA
jgi:hypothetical protein